MGALSIANEMPSDRPGVTTVSKGKKKKKKSFNFSWRKLRDLQHIREMTRKRGKSNDIRRKVLRMIYRATHHHRRIVCQVEREGWT